MIENKKNTHFERLKAVCWGSARQWSPIARDFLLDYYEKVLPVWPENQVKLLPHSGVLTEAFSTRLSAAERERINLMLLAVIDKAEDSGVVLTSVNRSLVRFILTCAVLIERGDLASSKDPAEPLLQLFEEGYELFPSHGAVDICYQFGCTSVPLPTREAVAQRAASHG